MASEVDISNLALGYLGDDATVASLSPPEGSAQAEHCARFYPIARDSLLERHCWGFATRRSSLALLAEASPSEWKYTYAVPDGLVNAIAVVAPDAVDDYSVGYAPYGNTGLAQYSPQTYTMESDASGAQVIYTNQENAVLRYTVLVSDTTKFSPLFVEALSWLLASKLAGPVLKGETGAKMALSCMQAYQLWFAQATMSDANQQRAQVAPVTNWIAAR